MPTKRLPKLSVARQRTESKENLVSPLILAKAAGRNMPRKRSRSDPGDTNSVGEAVLRMSQEANNRGSDAYAVEGINQSDGEENNSRHINAARLYAQSVEKANARKPGNCKRIKISSDNKSVVDQLLSHDGRVVTASCSACESLGQLSINILRASSPTAESAVSNSVSRSKSWTSIYCDSMM